MADIQSIKEEFLTCSICTEEYTDPCTLNCQHSFCRKCLTQFLKTRPDSVQSKTIPCAFCRQVTPAPNPTKPVEEWSKQLKPSLMLQGLMDKLQSGQKQANGVNVKQRTKVKCKEHENEQIKFICKDCNKTVCQICCVVKHSACKNVITMRSTIPEIKLVLTEKRRILETNMEANIAVVRAEESIVEKLNNNVKRTKEEIKSTIENAIMLLRKRGNDLVKELHDASDGQIAEHQAKVKSGQITSQMYQQHCEYIDQALQSESEVDMYDMYLDCLSGAVESVGYTESNTIITPALKEMKFTPNIESLHKAIAEMGKMYGTFVAGKRDFDTMIPVLNDTTDIQHMKDTTSADPIDVTVLVVGGVETLVFADYVGKCLKSMIINTNKKQRSRLSLSDKPLRLTKMTGNVVAVTLANKQIVTAEVRLELVLISTLNTSKQYKSLTSLSDTTMVAGSDSPPSVDFLDMTGNVLRSFTPRNTGLKLIHNPFGLCITQEGNILVSDCGSKSLYCLTSEGGVVFTYTPTGGRALNFPAGITVINTGNILLANSGSGTIFQLASNGTYVRDLLTDADGICDPWGMCIVDNNKLYVCERGGHKCIRVFGLPDKL